MGYIEPTLSWARSIKLLSRIDVQSDDCVESQPTKRTVMNANWRQYSLTTVILYCAQIEVAAFRLHISKFLYTRYLLEILIALRLCERKFSDDGSKRNSPENSRRRAFKGTLCRLPPGPPRRPPTWFPFTKIKFLLLPFCILRNLGLLKAIRPNNLV